ncbi:MAG: ATP-binding protein [Candidatus Dormibacteria bacterium]
MEAETHRPFVGRDGALRRLLSALETARNGRPSPVIVSGEAGIGKTSLIAEMVTRAEGVALGWGTCVDAPGAPGFWPWSQALSGLMPVLATSGAHVYADDRQLLSYIVPELGSAPDNLLDDVGRERLRLFDAVRRWLRSTARDTVIVVLDDLQWADTSSLALLDFLARTPPGPGVLLLGAFRHDELRPPTADVLNSLTARSDHIHLRGLDADEIAQLVASVAGPQRADQWAADVFRRSEGHPLFARELAQVLPEDVTRGMPRAVRDAIRSRCDRLSAPAARLLAAAAVLGYQPPLDVAADALGMTSEAVDGAIREAMRGGVLGGRPEAPHFAHDLFREALVDGLTTTAARDLHHRLAVALQAREARIGDVPPSEISRHLTGAVSLAGPDTALRWALAAAAADQSKLALEEATGHLTRLREALVASGVVVDDGTWLDLLVAEADASGRAGHPDDARRLLARARTRAEKLGDHGRLAAVAFGVQRLGARFAMPRDEVIDVLEAARQAVPESQPALRARLTAMQARELHHSIPEHRSRAVPLSGDALALARASNDQAALAAALLAHHDILWTPGAGAERVGVAREITSLARGLKDPELEAEGLLLTANALLETGSAAFRPALQAYLDAVRILGQPRHRYFEATRRAALALLDGRLDEAEDGIERAAELGASIGEPDAGNVRMSQRLELIRARGDPDEQHAFAQRAVEWWTGAPVHAHAVAAGFNARAGDLAAARRELDTVLELGGWQADRSYLWSVYVANLTDAAAALGDTDVARRLLTDLTPLGYSCGVNGAVVAFAGCHAHSAAVVARSLGHDEKAVALLDGVRAVYQRLGAQTWQTAAEAALGDWRHRQPDTTGLRDDVVLRRGERSWSITYRSTTTTLPDVKGWRDLAILVRQPGREVHVLELSEAQVEAAAPDDLADHTAIGQYRRALQELEESRVAAEATNDLGRVAALGAEEELVAAELRRVTGLGGRRRRSPDSAERARKAVSARIHDAIRRLRPAAPELAAHLERNVVTGNWCRYRAEAGLVWRVEP